VWANAEIAAQKRIFPVVDEPEAACLLVKLFHLSVIFQLPSAGEDKKQSHILLRWCNQRHPIETIHFEALPVGDMLIAPVNSAQKRRVETLCSVPN